MLSPIVRLTSRSLINCNQRSISLSSKYFRRRSEWRPVMLEDYHYREAECAWGPLRLSAILMAGMIFGTISFHSYRWRLEWMPVVLEMNKDDEIDEE